MAAPVPAEDPNILSSRYQVLGSAEEQTFQDFEEQTGSNINIESSLTSFLVTGTLSTSTVFSTTRLEKS